MPTTIIKVKDDEIKEYDKSNSVVSLKRKRRRKRKPTKEESKFILRLILPHT